MQRMMKRVLSWTLAACLLMAVFTPAMTQNVSALSYSGSSGYMSGKYYRALTQVQLTGDPRTDIVNIALSQVGYQEGGSSNQLSGEVFGGVNFTEYGRWYGVQSMWCAMFASWCADVAGISTDVIPKHAYTPDGLQWFRNRGRAYSRAKVAAGEYEPQPGDLIYFKSSRNKNPTNHVGIVSGYSDGVVYVVEGNTSSASISTNGGTVAHKSYSVTNTYIVYICCPDYGRTGLRLTEAEPERKQTVQAAKPVDELAALRQAIYTMETGDKSSYDQVTDAYGTITVGSGQWHGEEARELLLRIRKADTKAFTKLDTALIGQDLAQADWSSYRVDDASEKSQCIRKILGSPAGIRVQDEMMNEMLTAYRKEAKALGVKKTDAQLFCAGLLHLCGSAALQQVLDEVEGGYTLQNICAAVDTVEDPFLQRSAGRLRSALD